MASAGALCPVDTVAGPGFRPPGAQVVHAAPGGAGNAGKAGTAREEGQPPVELLAAEAGTVMMWFSTS
jgi:hypothetical protein